MILERETGIEPASSAWKAGVLPLNYSRVQGTGKTDEQGTEPSLLLLVLLVSVFCPLFSAWWREVDSNHRRRKPADLQSAPVGRLGIPPENQLSVASLVLLPAPCRSHSGARRRREVDDSGLPALRPPGRAAFASRSKLFQTILSNHRRRKPADLQSAPVGRLGIPPENQLSVASLVPLPAPCRLHSGARRRREVDDSGLPALRPPGRAAFASRSKLFQTILSNHRRRKPADLQSAPVGRLGIPPENQLSVASLVPLPAPCRLHSGARRRREVDDSGLPALRPPGRAAFASRSDRFLPALKPAVCRCLTTVRSAFGPTKTVYFRDVRAMCQHLPGTAADLFAFFSRQPVHGAILTGRRKPPSSTIHNNGSGACRAVPVPVACRPAACICGSAVRGVGSWLDLIRPRLATAPERPCISPESPVRTAAQASADQSSDAPGCPDAICFSIALEISTRRVA